MRNIIRFVVSMALVLVFLLGSLPPVLACGPYYLNPLFSFKKHADYPLAEYNRGKVGVVPDSYGRMSLFVFYRYLNNLSLTAAEQKQIDRAMSKTIVKYQAENEETGTNQADAPPEFFARWLAARAKVLTGETKIDTEKLVSSGYNYFPNCLPDAFNSATKTLENRIAQYGVNQYTKEWVKAQDTVFANCQYTQGPPAALGDDSPEWLRRDRQYQIAASLFYTGDFAGARANFEKIAADENSPWSKTARFVVARTYIRQASFIELPEDVEARKQPENERSELLQKASAQLENVLSDARMSDFQSSAQRLLGLVKYRSIPHERQKELGKILASPGENHNIYNDLIDYTWLLEHTSDEAERTGTELDRQQAEQEKREYDYNYRLKLRDVPAEERENDLTDWLLTYQAEDGFAHAFEKWKETGKAQWLVAAIEKTSANIAQAAEIMSAAERIQINSPAFATVRYHQIRLLLEMGNRAEAKQKLNEILSKNSKDLPVSAQNKFFAQRLSLAENLEEFLKFAQRKPVAFVWSDDDSEAGSDIGKDKAYSAWAARTMFDEDAAEFFNTRMPLVVLREATLSSQLPAHLKKFLVVAVWTRAFILGNEALEREFTPLVARYAKEYSTQFSRYAAAAGQTNREAGALMVILRYPVIEPFVPVGFGRDTDLPYSIDSNRGNWWCAKYKYVSTNWNDEDTEKKFVLPTFLTAEQTAAAESEVSKMIELGDSATFLARRAVEFAAQNPNHPSTPEILHLAVRSTRFGCTDDQTAKFSQQAFQILHKRYPNSVWTKKTPFWFGSIE